MLTEDEAKQKWCPFARIGGGQGVDGAAYNRIEHHGGDISHTAAQCIGSACMAWRWEPISRLTHRPQERLHGISYGDGTFWNEPERPAFINAEWLWDAARGHWYVGKPQGALGACGLATSS